MRIHLVGVCGTGMGQLAMLLREAHHDVSGSDASFDPPMGPALVTAGIRCLDGYVAEHITADIELVVVGNAIRRGNPEVVAAEERGLPRTSMSAALRERFLVGRRPLVVAGTHGKTTTSAMCAWILDRAGLEPGFFIGGLPKGFTSGARIGRTKKRLDTRARGDGAPERPLLETAPFVVEGDEYDAVFWHKEPKFFDYIGVGTDDVAIVTSVEHDHIDIYPTREIYEAQFAKFAEAVPKDGLIVCDAHDARARAIVGEHATAHVAYYGLEGDDTGSVTPQWSAAMVPPDPASAATPFDLFAGGSSCGRFALAVPGEHNVRNAVAAIAACAEGFGVGVAAARTALASFAGVKRRQDLIGRPNGIAIYDDFAHHPTAVDETLRALKARHPGGALWAVFEPRSATAVRNLHQHEYPPAFQAADRVLLAPLGRANIPDAERLDLDRIAREIGSQASVATGVDAIIETIASGAAPGDTVAILSNGAFGGIHQRLIDAIHTRVALARDPNE